MVDSQNDGADAAPQAAQEIKAREVSIPEALEIAVKLQRTGEFAQAEEIYIKVLKHQPDEPNALNFLGILRHQQGRTDDALHYIAMAIQRLPGVPGPWLNLANVLLETSQFDEAIEALQQVIALDPDNVSAYNNLGVLHMRRREWDQAEQCLQTAIERNPKIDYLYLNLATLCFKTGRLKESIAHGVHAIGLDSTNSAGHEILSRALFKDGQSERATQVLRDWLANEPDNPRAIHHLAAAGVGEAPPRASDAYVEEVFDAFAASFDVKLEGLGYRAPQLVAQALTALDSRLPTGGVILDAGCGTGLCGPLLRPLGERMEGVDLSAGMLARAGARGGYDALHHAELTAFLHGATAAYDIIASADTLVYFGDLDELMAGVAGALRPGGVFAASVEALLDDAADHHLAVHGRYAHSAAYIRALLERHGLQLGSITQEVLRSEFREDVQGWIFTALKPLPA